MDSAICVLPWNHLATHPDGHVSLCCRVNYPANAGFAETASRERLSLSRASVDATRNSDSFKQARRQMLSGEMPLACKGCADEEVKGVRSKRLLENANFPETYRAILENGKIEVDRKIEFVELRLGNKCNLKCRTCNPNSSSGWKKDYKLLSDSLSFVTNYDEPNTDWIDSKEFWSELLEHSSSLKIIYINGGEPALIDQHWAFLESLSQGEWSKNVRLTYNSNITIIPEKAFEIWPKFRSVHMSASIDDIGVRNGYLRPPSKWDTIEKNILRLKNSGVHLAITQTISAMNIFYYPEFRQWSDEIGVYAEPNFVFDPPFLAVQALPLEVRKDVFHQIQSSIRAEDSERFRHWCLGPDRPDLWIQFQKYTKKLDEIRGEKFSEVFPELYQLLSGQLSDEIGL